jgi:TetR/AcrR family transcriptional repressor of nem operon
LACGYNEAEGGLNDQPNEAGQRRGTRERIIQAAMELFYAQGYHATGLAQILKTAGVNSGSLYHFFESKEALLLAVLETYREMLWPVLLEPNFAKTEDPIERIFALLDGYRQGLIVTDCTAGCPIGNLALELNEFHPEAQRRIVLNFDGWKAAIQGCLEAAADRFPAGTDFRALATFVLTTMEGAIMQSRSYRSLEPFDTSVALLRDYLARLAADGDGV